MIKRLAVVLCLALCLLPGRAAGRAQAPPPRPKLVVFLVVDQMRADYLTRYGDLFTRGLKRLTTQGAWYQKAAYPYLMTVTCVGHTTLGTGAFPYHHGMIQNQWYNRATAKTATCNADPEVTEIGYDGPAGPGNSGRNILVPTLADRMRDTLHSRVATMSIKARSAIGLAGHGGDLVLWFGDRGNGWETSSAFSSAPSPWFDAYVRANPISADAGKTWEPALAAARYQGADDAPGEHAPGGWETTFPHPLGAAGDAQFRNHWLQSPFADDYLERMAEAAVDELHLGTANRTDFLGVSFSMLDSVGHAFGPRSREVQDVLVRLDASIGRLLDFLDKEVGAGSYVVALSADHGVADLPEQVSDGGRQSGAAVRGAVEAAVKPLLGGDGPFVVAAGTEVYFGPGVYDRIKADPRILHAVVSAAGALPGIARVLTSGEVATPAARASKDPVIRAAALSYYPGRSGDLLLVMKPDWIMAATGTTHGTANPYDQRVPVLLFGAGIRPGPRDEAATPADIAPTLAAMVGVRLPSPDGRVLTSAFRK